MNAKKTAVINGIKIEKYWWASEWIVYINNTLSDLTFDEACKKVEQEAVMKDSPAFPIESSTARMYSGMTLQQYAAIHLLQPTSGLDWLDDMIRARMRDEMAGKALQGLTVDYGDRAWSRIEYGEEAMRIADAMMKQREEKNG